MPNYYIVRTTYILVASSIQSRLETLTASPLRVPAEGMTAALLSVSSSLTKYVLQSTDATSRPHINVSWGQM